MSTAKRAMIVRPPGLFQSQSNSQAFWRPFRFKINPFAISPNGANGLPAKKELPGKMSRKGYFAPLLDALRKSRRLQAARVLRRYRHLVAEEHNFKAQDNFSNGGIAQESN
jgi:hypothetical protein